VRSRKMIWLTVIKESTKGKNIYVGKEGLRLMPKRGGGE